MSAVLDTFARFARPILLVDSALLLAGILLTAANMLLLGWSVYAVGHVLAIVAFASIGVLNRDRMDAWSWVGLGVLVVGLVLGLPQVATIWSSYANTPTGALMVVPSQTLPIGLLAELVTWVGLAFYGLAARGSRALPAGVGWLFVVAAVIALLAALEVVPFISPLWWVPAMLVMTLGLIAVGAGLSPLAQRALDAATPAAPEPVATVSTRVS